MTSYEGLFLATRRSDEGAAVLRRAAATVSEGMLANTADTGTLEYNTADGTLWFIHALGRHVALTGDDASPPSSGRRWPRSSRRHLDGTRFGIGVDAADGLLSQGADGWALTWMDARIDGVPVTPRAGKPVEVNALWIEALSVAGELARNDACDARSRQPRRARSPRASPGPTGAACSTWSTARRATTRRCGRISCSRSRSRTGRSRASPSSRGAWSTRAAPRC